MSCQFSNGVCKKEHLVRFHSYLELYLSVGFFFHCCRSVFSASQGTANESIMGEDMADHSQDVSQSWGKIIEMSASSLG